MKRKINKKNILLIAIPVVLIIGLIIYIKVSDYYYDIRVKKDIAQHMNETVRRWSKNDSDESSLSDIQKYYYYFEFECSFYMNKNVLSDSEKHTLVLMLYGLYDKIKQNILNTSNGAFGEKIDDDLLKCLDETTNRMESLWDKMNNSEFVTYSEKEQFQKDLNFLKDLSNI